MRLLPRLGAVLAAVPLFTARTTYSSSVCDGSLGPQRGESTRRPTGSES